MQNLVHYFSLFEAGISGNQAVWFWIFSIAWLIFIGYYLIIYSRIIWYKPKKRVINPDPVSVIIASRDDAEMLRKHLTSVLEQKGVDYEVIVVDDCSVDDTIDVLREYSEKYPHFRHSKLVENGAFEGGKKFAITIGIKAAKYQNLVFIDADCYPSSDQWLRKIAEGLMVKKIVLGYSPYQKEPGFLNKIIRYDTYKIALNYLSYAMSGIPYMGVGRNLGYQSYLYFDAKGFANHLNVVSGDDDLFINEVANKHNTGIEISPETHVYSIAKDSYAQWEYQKRRHLTTASQYKFHHQVLLFLFSLTQYVLTISFLVLLFVPEFMPFVLVLFGIKLLVQGIVQYFAMDKLKVMDLFVWSFVLDFLLLLFYPWISFLNIINEDQRRRWI